MQNHQLLNGLSGNLQSSTAWAQQQALEHILRNVEHAMQSLLPQQKTEYLKLQRDAHAAISALEAEKNALVQSFKSHGLEQLRTKLDGRDPEQYRIYTNYLETIERGLPWDPQPPQKGLRRPRDLDESRYKLHTKSLTLWEAACMNYGFTHSIPQDSGFSLVQASTIKGPGAHLDTLDFINIARELNLGDQLQLRTQAALANDGKLRGLFIASARAMMRFELLEAFRTRDTTGISRWIFEKLHDTLEASGPALNFDTASLNCSRTTIIETLVDAIPLPLLIIDVAHLGVVSYFSGRPGGAFRHHADISAAGAALRQQLKDSHQQQDLSWFTQQLPLTGLTTFISLVKQPAPRPEGLSWLAGHAYDAFEKVFPALTLEAVRFPVDPKPFRPVPRKAMLVETLADRQIERYRSDVATLATTRSDADWQALKAAVAGIAAEILNILLTPMPGGVSGMNRIMQLAVMGSISYSSASGLDAALQGQPVSFASALADLADLAITGRLMSVASRAHQLRVQRNLQALGQPRKVTRPDGAVELWKPDAQRYAFNNQNLLNGRIADALGIYAVRDQTYAKLRQGDKTLVVEVSQDAHSLRYVLKHTVSGSYNPPIIFEPALQAWVFDLTDAHTLSDIQLLQRMLPNDSSTVPSVELEQMLRSTATPRATLDAVWNSQPAPLNLIEGTRRLQADQAIGQIIERFNEPGYLPPHGDSLVFSLLTQLPNWPADTLLRVQDEHGVLIETYAKAAPPSSTAHSVTLTRQEDGRYADRDNQRLPPGTQEPLLRLIIRQQPAASVLGKEDRLTYTEEQRISAVRRQIGELARTEHSSLFSAVVNYASYEKTELIPPAPVRRYLPLNAPSTLLAVTPLLKKLRDLNRPLTPALLNRLLDQHPLTPRQQQNYLKHGQLPLAFHELLSLQRIALRIDAVIDSLYHPREFAEDTDQWAREFASALVRNTLKRPFIVTDVAAGKPYKSTGPDDPTVELRHYGNGHYRAYDMRNGGEILVSPQIDSFYLAIGSVLQPHEREQLGMNSATDAKGLRKTLGDYMSNQRNPKGFVSLANGSLEQYEQPRLLPPGLKPAANGVFEHNMQHYLPLYGSLYRITFDNSLHKWRLVHPKKTAVDTPTLEHNGEGAWRLTSENPMTWDDHRLLYRLGNHRYAFTKGTSETIMALTDTPTQALRQAHSTSRAAPPLLADTCKRFKIDEQIHQFLEAIRTNPTSHIARPDLQLLMLQGMQGWPADHVLQIVDSQQRVLKQYPADTPPNAQVIKVTEQEYESGRLLEIVIKNDKVCQGLLNETPPSHDDRLFKLVQKLVEFTQQKRTQVFDSVYAQSELNGSAQEKRFKAHYPQLPTSTVKAILGQASSRELKQLHEQNEVGLRLSEQARLSSHDVRLNRAYEGLLLPSCVNADSDKITLHLLKSLATWPASLRIDIHQGSYQGPWLESAGHLGGTVRHRLAKTSDGYQAYDARGLALGSPSNSLLHALVQSLSASEQVALGITDSDDVSPLRQQILVLALGRRVAIKGLLDLPHLQPWMQPPMSVDSSFLAYPIWGLRWLFGGNRPTDLVAKVQEIYQGLSTIEAQSLIDSMNMSAPAVLLELDRRKAEYTAMNHELMRWSNAARPEDNVTLDPLGLQRGQRSFIANQLRNAWLRQTSQAYVAGLFDVHSLELQLNGGDLPPANFLSGLTGFAHIEHLSLSADSFPGSGAAFLAKFSGLKALKIECGLSVLPPAITDMVQLTRLDLSHNNMVLTEEASTRLASMVNLVHLDLSHNVLGNTPDVTGMRNLDVLDLRNSEISRWPTGTWDIHLLELHLEENFISSIPEQVLNDPLQQQTNNRTFLHGNPLSQATLQQIADYRQETGLNLGGRRLETLHELPSADNAGQWLKDVPVTEHAERRWLWKQLVTNKPESADDVFRVLRDLPKTYAYGASQETREALTDRVWTLLQAMGESAELRKNVCLNTYGAGSCGDSALLAFTNMELQHRIHLAKLKSRSYESDRALIDLATARFYLNQLDHLSDKFIADREKAGLETDPAEVTIYFRAQLAKEFNLPFYQLELLYTVGEYVTPAVIDAARTQLHQLGLSPALQEALLMEGFWIEYLARSHPEPFSTVKDTIQYKINQLNRELPDRKSDAHLERRQSLIDEGRDEQNRLVRQLTVATQAALKRS